MNKIKKILTIDKASFRESIFKKRYPNQYDLINNNIKSFNLELDSFSSKLWHTIYNIHYIPKCKICNKELIYVNFTKGYRVYCSNACSAKDIELKKIKNKNRIKTNKIKYGTNNPLQNKKIREKANKTNLKKYGYSHPMKNKDIKEKVKITNTYRYGSEYTFQSKEIQDKIKKVNQEKYNVDYAFQSKEIQNKKYNTNLKKYGCRLPIQNKSIQEKIIANSKNTHFNKLKKYLDKLGYTLISQKNLILKCYCNKCSKNFEITIPNLHNRYYTNIEICTNCRPLNFKISSFENAIVDFLKYNNIKNIEQSNRTILNGKEIDIYLSDYKIGIEYNGLYYHSELYKNNNYHQNKSLLAKEKDVQLLHVYEDDWLYKQPIVKSVILSKLGIYKEKIYGRKTIIKEVSSKEKNRFLTKNHLQGKDNSSIKLGLYYNDELVSLMTFGKPSIDRGFKNKNKTELKRFCNKLNTSIIGGASKLFKYFIKNYYDKNVELFSYADLSYSNGNLYEKLDFTFDSITKPNYYYIINGLREHRYKYAKHKLIKEGFNKNETEKQIMLNRGIYRIYNSGNLKYIK